MWGMIENSTTGLTMVEEDYGIILPITIDGVEFGSADAVQFTVKTEKNGSTLVTKSLPIVDNTAGLSLSAAETALLPAGTYVYNLDWYQNGVFLCNLINSGRFKVVDKA